MEGHVTPPTPEELAESLADLERTLADPVTREAYWEWYTSEENWEAMRQEVEAYLDARLMNRQMEALMEQVLNGVTPQMMLDYLLHRSSQLGGAGMKLIEEERGYAVAEMLLKQSEAYLRARQELTELLQGADHTHEWKTKYLAQNATEESESPGFGAPLRKSADAISRIQQHKELMTGAVEMFKDSVPMLTIPLGAGHAEGMGIRYDMARQSLGFVLVKDGIPVRTIKTMSLRQFARDLGIDRSGLERVLETLNLR